MDTVRFCYKVVNMKSFLLIISIVSIVYANNSYRDLDENMREDLIIFRRDIEKILEKYHNFEQYLKNIGVVESFVNSLRAIASFGSVAAEDIFKPILTAFTSSMNPDTLNSMILEQTIIFYIYLHEIHMNKTARKLTYILFGNFYFYYFHFYLNITFMNISIKFYSLFYLQQGLSLVASEDVKHKIVHGSVDELASSIAKHLPIDKKEDKTVRETMLDGIINVSNNFVIYLNTFGKENINVADGIFKTLNRYTHDSNLMEDMKNHILIELSFIRLERVLTNYFPKKKLNMIIYCYNSVLCINIFVFKKIKAFFVYNKLF